MKKSIIKSSIAFFNGKWANYSKEEVSEYSFNIEGDKLTIKNTCSNLKIKKGDFLDVKITMKKQLGGTNGEELKDSLKSIYCEVKDGVIYVNPLSKNISSINSTNIETIIMIPNNINSLEIESKIGNVLLDDDYDVLDINMNIGELDYTGELKKCYINSKIGDIRLNLNEIKDYYKYKISKEIGNIKVIVPKSSKINIIGISTNDIKGEIEISSDGAIIDINKKISNISIDN
ncbi:hypothetical protein LZ906_007685 [Paraclostridium ghonii]|uniref:hypothetical protein n=1 Tax=Paraclostridium ghonii TaxID=29358 RepID=UPI00202CDA65|nr:hypothetical protein [Paeniclostridium ghonii]MCM0165630.1 hypothetical protein [Paeniclostridium ghonii]